MDSLDGCIIRNDHSFQINIYYLHYNPEEWQEPEKFIPERFDPESKFYLRPDGMKRHPFSYGPYLGGKRVCLGKDFAESLAKIMITMIVN